jgi:hypothetical protein
VQTALSLPPSWQAQGLILLGYSAKEIPQKERLDVGQVKRVV